MQQEVMQQEVDNLSNQVKDLKVELYDLAKSMATMSQAYSDALLQASQVFNLSYNGKLPTSVSEFQAALNEL